jgi:hypothetical protein
VFFHLILFVGKNRWAFYENSFLLFVHRKSWKEIRCVWAFAFGTRTFYFFEICELLQIIL